MTTKNKPLFSRKIKCSHCSKYYKRKIEGRVTKHNVYVCSLYDNKGECVRNAIHEDYLVELIERRLNKKLDRYDVEKYIQMIMIEQVDPYLLEIHFTDEQETILFSRDFIRF